MVTGSWDGPAVWELGGGRSGGGFGWCSSSGGTSVCGYVLSIVGELPVNDGLIKLIIR